MNVDINTTGLNYESYLSWINDEDESYTEYIVGKDYLINVLKESKYVISRYRNIFRNL